MPKTRRHTYNAAFKLKALKRALDIGNKTTAQEIGINEAIVRKGRKQTA